MSNIFQAISASILLPRRLRRWVSTRSQSFMPKSSPFGNIEQGASDCLNQPTTETRTRVVGESLPQILGFYARIHSVLNFHRVIPRIPDIHREAIHPPVPLIPPNFYTSVEALERTEPTSNSSQLTTESNHFLGLSCYNPQHMNVESDANSGPSIEPNNALGLFFSAPPSGIPNVESLSTTLSPLFQTPRDEASVEGNLFPFEPLGSDLNLFRQNSQTTDPSANYSQPFIEPNNALDLWLDGHKLDVQPFSVNSSWPTIEPNNALGLSLGHPSISIGSSAPALLELYDDSFPELPEQLNADFNFYGDDVQTGANVRQPTIEPNNFHQTQPESSSHKPQDIGRGTSVGMQDLTRRKLIPNPTPWEIKVPPPGPLRTDFNPFWDVSNTHFSDEAISYSNPSNGTLGEQPSKSQELTVTFGGKIGRQVRWQDIMPSVDHFIERCTRDTSHSLTVILEPSGSTYDQWERRQTLKQLFDRLKLTEPVATCIGERHGRDVDFKRISITVPDKAEDVDMILVASPWNNSSGANWEKIDITSASNLREFLWNGPFQQLSESFLYPAHALTLLSITGCEVSVNDTVELLEPCSSLEEVQLETVHGTKVVEPEILKSGGKFKFTLNKLLVTSSVDLAPLLKLITWTLDGAELNSTFLDNGAQDANALLSAEFVPKHVALNFKGRFLEGTMDELQASRIDDN